MANATGENGTAAEEEDIEELLDEVPIIVAKFSTVALSVLVLGYFQVITIRDDGLLWSISSNRNSFDQWNTLYTAVADVVHHSVSTSQRCQEQGAAQHPSSAHGLLWQASWWRAEHSHDRVSILNNFENNFELVYMLCQWIWLVKHTFRIAEINLKERSCVFFHCLRALSICFGPKWYDYRFLCFRLNLNWFPRSSAEQSTDVRLRGNGSPATECSTVTPSWLLFLVPPGKPLYRRVLPGMAVKDIVWLNNSTSAV